MMKLYAPLRIYGVIPCFRVQFNEGKRKEMGEREKKRNKRN